MSTKRIVFVSLCALIVLVLSSTGAFAQTTAGSGSGSGIGFGIKGGVVFPNFRTDLSVDNRTGYNAGMFFGGDRTNLFGIQGEVNWLRLGTNVTDPVTGLTARTRVDYIQVPVLARLNIGTKSKNGIAVYGIAGPSFDGKIHENVTAPVPTPNDAFEDFNVSLLFGAGLEVTRILFEARYAVGLKQVNRNFQDVADVKVNHFAILVGLRFN